jgi:hypothetical protein
MKQVTITISDEDAERLELHFAKPYEDRTGKPLVAVIAWIKPMRVKVHFIGGQVVESTMNQVLQ